MSLTIRFNLLVMAFLALGLCLWWSRAVTLDDAFISYRYAANLIAGHGLVYNPGERVEGYSNFLWVMLSAAGMALGLPPLAVTRGIGLIAYFCGALLCVYLARTESDSRRTTTCILLFLLVLYLPVGLLESAGAGLETSFIGSLQLALGILLFYRPTQSHVGKFWAALLPAGLVLTRLDAALPVLAAVVLLYAFAPGTRYDRVKATLRTFVVSGVIVLIYLGWKLSYYGSIFPNTYYAKAADLWSWQQGIAYWQAFVASNPQAVICLLLSIYAIYASRSTGARQFAWYVVLTLLLRVAYVGKVGGDFMQFRFAWESYPLLVSGATLGLAAMATVVGRSAIVLIGLLAVLLSLQREFLDDRYGQQTTKDMHRFVVEGTRTGLALNSHLPADTVISTTLAGTIGYYSGRVTIDQWGLNDAYVAKLPVSHIVTRGHVKFAPTDYLVRRGVNLYFAHPQLCSCANPCRENLPNVFIRVRGDECARSWYLVQTPELTRYFCERPGVFILNNVSCPAES